MKTKLLVIVGTCLLSLSAFALTSTAKPAATCSSCQGQSCCHGGGCCHK